MDIGPAESEAERQQRLSCEADAKDPGVTERRHHLTMTGLADVGAGRLIDDEAMQAWADSLGTEKELPVPQPR